MKQNPFIKANVFDAALKEKEAKKKALSVAKEQERKRKVEVFTKKAIDTRKLKGEKGDKGDDGKRGKAGLDGKQGDTGSDGIQGDTGEQGKAGLDGINGVDGRGVKSAKIEDGYLIIHYTDGKKVNAGKVEVTESGGRTGYVGNFGGVNRTYRTISIDGQDDVVAEGAADTLTYVAGNNISLTTDADTDTITINSVPTLTNADGNYKLLSTDDRVLWTITNPATCTLPDPTTYLGEHRINNHPDSTANLSFSRSVHTDDNYLLKPGSGLVIYSNSVEWMVD